MEKVRIAKDRDGRQKSFAFITYCHEVSVPYAIRLFQGTSLFHRKLTLQERGKSALPLPPIRCYGADFTFEFKDKDISNQFVNMTDKLREEVPVPSHLPIQRQESNDKLVMASLQGNWSHRHHPYRPKEKANNQDKYKQRGQDNYRNRNNWKNKRDYRARRRD